MSENEPSPRWTHRFIGRLRGAPSGPTLVVVAALHGNEPAGLEAAARVLARLRQDRTPLRGEVACLIGNLGALGRGVRYQVKDLNRAWTAERMQALDAAKFRTPWDAEDSEQVAMYQAIEQIRRTARGPVTVLDLHTTSGEGPPFVIVSDTPSSREFGGRLGLTCVAGLVERLGGMMLGALAQTGIGGAVVECGRTGSPESMEHAEAATWIALVAAGLVEESDLPHLGALRRLLAAARGTLPETVEIVHRHEIRPQDGFEMAPGFRHFQLVQRGEVLAQDVRGDVVAPHSGYLLMPLYQGLGDDGFFLGRAP